jgi:Zn-dependent M28 family amino/carboxypeptidase
VIVSAHLDHIGRASVGPDRINNGADDNASGVTGVLLMADAFAQLKQRPRRSILFMTFWGEEKGLLGSKYFVQHPLWPLDRIVANINLEMIGRPETGAESKAWMTGWEHSNLGLLMAVGAKRAEVEIFDHKKFGKMLYRASDNFPFVQSGVIAHSFSAGSLHSDYHQPGDEWEKLDLPHMTRIIRGLVAATLPIANGDLTPHVTTKK